MAAVWRSGYWIAEATLDNTDYYQDKKSDKTDWKM